MAAAHGEIAPAHSHRPHQGLPTRRPAVGIESPMTWRAERRIAAFGSRDVVSKSQSSVWLRHHFCGFRRPGGLCCRRRAVVASGWELGNLAGLTVLTRLAGRCVGSR